MTWPESGASRRHRLARRGLAVAAAAAALAAAVLLPGDSATAPAPAPPVAGAEHVREPPGQGAGGPVRPLLGTHYSHVAHPRCRMDGGGIVATRTGHATRAQVVQQLRSMRERGVDSLRIILWHMHDPSGHTWGVVASAGGRLHEPDRSNLVHYLRAVREAGFDRLTITFSPQWTNSPFEPNYDRRLLEENWSWVRDVRAVAVEHGPAQVRFDLLNEGGASDYLPPRRFADLRSYVATLYGRYADEFGTRDVTVSTIASLGPHDRGNRLRNLVSTLRSTGRPLPRWFDVHLNVDGPTARHGLDDSVRVLDRQGLPQPLVIGEAPHGDPAVARALAGSPALERVEEVLQWVDRPGDTCPRSPPYSVASYRDALAVVPPAALAPSG